MFDDPRYCTIEDLEIEGNIDIADAESEGQIGLFCQYAEECTFTNCSVVGTIRLSNIGDTAEIGGFIGASQFCTFMSCSSAVDIEISCEYTVSIGGFIGGSYSSNLFYKCVAYGNMIFDTQISNTVGGFAGLECEGVLVSSYALGDITVSSEYAYEVGGFTGIGIGNVLFLNCGAYGDVDVEGEAFQIGGFSGGTIGACNYYNCYALGDIKGSSAVGGFLGYLDSDITIANCYSAGIVTGNEESDTNAAIGAFLGTMNDVLRVSTSGDLEDQPFVANNYCFAVEGYPLANLPDGALTAGNDEINSVDFTNDDEVNELLTSLNAYVTDNPTLSELYKFYDDFVREISGYDFSDFIDRLDLSAWTLKNVKNAPIHGDLSYVVEYLDEDGSVIKSTTLYFGQVIEDIQLTPELPEKNGFTVAWDSELVAEDIDVYALKNITIQAVYTEIPNDDPVDDPVEDDQPETRDFMESAIVLCALLGVSGIVGITIGRKKAR